ANARLSIHSCLHDGPCWAALADSLLEKDQVELAGASNDIRDAGGGARAWRRSQLALPAHTQVAAHRAILSGPQLCMADDDLRNHAGPLLRRAVFSRFPLPSPVSPETGRMVRAQQPDLVLAHEDIAGLAFSGNRHCEATVWDS